MRVLGVVWVGTRTTEYAATVAFFKDVLGLGEESSETDFAVLKVPDGSTVEVFGPTSRFNEHLTHPVAGFRVADIHEAFVEGHPLIALVNDAVRQIAQRPDRGRHTRDLVPSVLPR